MEWFSSIGIRFPITDPTWIFFLVLGIILFAPIIFGKLRIPHIIGMILAGMVIGEYGMNVITRDDSFRLFGNVGLLYIMFLAGLEMDMSNFKHIRNKAVVFGVLGFLVPMVAGYAVNSWLLDYATVPALLIASMYASHTLVSYPIVSRYGVSRQRSVSVSVGATAITDCLTLFLLAILGGLYKGEAIGGALNILFLVVKVAVLTCCVVFFFPRIGRWFFRKYSNGVLQFIFVLAMMFLSAGLMKIVGMEGILGAFLAGLVLNRLIPGVSTLMHNLEFVGNALFIPYFLIGVGMMINLKVFFAGWNVALLLAIMVVMAILTKWVTAWLTQKLCGMTALERQLMYGLSTSRAAATLAVVLVGYNIILPDGSHLLGSEILNGAIALILITCVVSSFATERASRKMALVEMEQTDVEVSETENILISVGNPATLHNLVSLAVFIRDERQQDNVIAVNVVSDNVSGGRAARMGKKSLEQAAQIAMGAAVNIKTVSRYSAGVATGVVHTAKEQDATTLIVGLHQPQTVAESFLGNINADFLEKVHREVIVTRMLMPFNTIRRIVVAIPAKAQFEAGFLKWVGHLVKLSKTLGCNIHFHGNDESLKFVDALLRMKKYTERVKLIPMEGWDDMLMLSAQVNYDHLFVAVSSRPGSVSYQEALAQLPETVGRYFNNCSIIIIYPDQAGESVQAASLFGHTFDAK